MADNRLGTLLGECELLIGTEGTADFPGHRQSHPQSSFEQSNLIVSTTRHTSPGNSPVSAVF